MSRQPRLRACRRLTVVLVVLSIFPAAIQAQPGADDEVAALRREIEEIKQTYEQRIADLERRLAEMEAARQGAAPPTAAPAPPVAPSTPSTGATQPEAEDPELAALRAAAQAEAGQTLEPTAPEGPATAEPTPEVIAGSERNLNRLNPEVSITGDVVGFADDQGNEDFNPREFELNFQSALDPFSLTKWTLSFSEEEGVDIEEGYVLYTGLRRGLQLGAGKFRQSFGVLNRWHLHALPQLDYPLALQTYFGEEGLAQTGLSATWLVPRPWATANELTFELTDGSSDAFGGESFDKLVGLAHLKNYWDVGEATYAELGLSGVQGGNGAGGTSRVLGADFTLHWQPPARAKYREITWRTELLRSERDDEEGFRHQAWGGYSYVEALLAQNLYAGLRYDRVEDPLDPGHVRWGLSPNVTWWQSEFVRLRGEYGYVEDGLTGDDENRFSLQIVWSAGPHKHETY